jgi:cytochrome c oxidase subunit I
VLYTSYAPLQAHWTYYLGLALVVVSTWLALRQHAGCLRLEARAPGRAHPAARVHLGGVVPDVGAGVAADRRLVPRLAAAVDVRSAPLIDPLLTRTLFWFTGHAIVYAWLLPAYVSWYALIPRQVDGKLISDSYTRITWILFLLLSIPTGFHHQYTDPGISRAMKAMHGVLTFGVFFPSLATAFSVMAALEIGGRRRGGTRAARLDPEAALGRSVRRRPAPGDAHVRAGRRDGPHQRELHHEPGHPQHHLGPGALPHDRRERRGPDADGCGVLAGAVPAGARSSAGRSRSRRAWVYTIGVLIFARGMISAGLEGMPRRTFLAEATYSSEAWRLPGILTGVGGTIMFVGVMLFFVVIGLTIVMGRKGEEPVDIPVSDTLTAPATSGWEPVLDRLGWWAVVAIVLILIAYGPFFLGYEYTPVSPGFRLF